MYKQRSVSRNSINASRTISIAILLKRFFNLQLILWRLQTHCITPINLWPNHVYLFDKLKI